MQIARYPGFTAASSLARSRGSYRSQVNGGPNSISLVQPQAFQIMRKGKCWCDEPDTRLVCQGGTCHEVPVCLQWSCPGQGIDDIDGSTDRKSVV